MLQRVGSYEVVRELARGGMGIVYAARDAALDRDVAIKIVLSATPGPEALERFRREGRAAARLRHPNIVGVHAIGQLPTGQPYLVMDLIEGESLHARVARQGPLPPAEATRLLAVVARALEYAHGRGVLHRDLKPANVLVDGDGAPHLTDFGLARMIDRASRMTATGEVMGTPAYMSPEQADGDNARVGPASDVYGLGATLYEVLTGLAPFHTLTGMAVIKAVLTQEPDAPSALRPGLDPALEAICLRCLAKEPTQRFVSAGALAQALEDWSERGGAGAARPRGGRRGSSPLPWVSAALALALVGAAVACVGALRSAAAARADAAAAIAARTDALVALEEARAAARAAPPPDGRVEAEGRVEATRRAERARAEALSVARRPSARAAELLTGALDLPELEASTRLDLLARRALVHHRLWRDDDARADVRAVLAEAPEHPLATTVQLGLDATVATPDGLARFGDGLDVLLARAPDVAEAHALRAMVHLVANDRAAARAGIERALALDPFLCSALCLRAKLRGKEGDHRGAVEDAAIATYLDPDDLSAWTALFQVAVGAGDLDRARIAAERMLELREDAGVRRQLAHLHEVEGDPREAQVSMSTAQLIELARRGSPKRAERALTRALAQAPTLDVDLLAWRAFVRLDLDLIDLARADCDVVQRAAPEHPLGWVVRTSLVNRAGASDLAKQMMKLLLERNPADLPEAYALQALLLASEGDRDGAKAALARAKELDPQFGRADAILAGILMATDAQASSQAAERAVELAPFYSKSWTMAALTRFQRGDLAGAELALNRSFELREEPDAFYVRGTVAFTRGDHAGGLAAVERAVEMRPLDPRLALGRVDMLLEMGRRDEAVRVAERALALLRPDEPAAAKLRSAIAAARR